MITTIKEFKNAAKEVADKYRIKKFYVEILEWMDERTRYTVVFFDGPSTYSSHGARTPESALEDAENQLKSLQEDPMGKAKELIESANKILVEQGRSPLTID
jgi:hypothetical protein